MNNVFISQSVNHSFRFWAVIFIRGRKQALEAPASDVSDAIMSVVAIATDGLFYQDPGVKTIR